MPAQQVAIRLGLEGGEIAKRGFQDLGATGAGAMSAIEAGATRASVATERLGQTADRQMARWQALAREAKIAADAQAKNDAFSAFSGIDRPVKSAEESARVFEALGKGASITSSQVQVLAGGIHHAADALIAGANPAQVLAQELVKVGGGLEATGGLAGLLTPKVLLMGGAIGLTIGAVLALTAAFLTLEAAEDKFSQSAQGVGRFAGLTGKQLEAQAEAAAKAGNTTVAAARESTAAFLAQGTIGAAVNAKLTASVRDYAAAAGVDAKAANQQLAADFADSAAGAERLNRMFGVLNASQLHHIELLSQEGRYEEAQLELFHALQPAIQGAADKQGILGSEMHQAAQIGDALWTGLGHLVERYEEFRTLGFLANDLHDQATAMDEATAAAAKYEAGLNRLSTAGFAVAQRLNPDLAAKDQLREAQDQAAKGSIAALIQGDIQAAVAEGEAFNRATQGLNTYVAAEEKRHRLALLQVQEQAAIGPARKAAIAAQIEALQLSGQTLTAEEREARIKDAYTAVIGAATAALAQESAERRLGTAELLKSAEAYLTSSAAGAAADAARAAALEAFLKGAEGARVATELLAQSAAEAAVQGGQRVAQLKDEVAARTAASAAVSAGQLTVEQANRQAAIELLLRPLLVAATNADAAGKRVLAAVMLDLVANQKALNAVNDNDALRASVEGTKARTAAIDAQTAAISRGRAAALLAAADAKSNEDDRQHPDASAEERAANRAASRVDALRQLAQDQRKYAYDTLQQEQARFDVSAAEFDLLGASPRLHDEILERLKLAIEIKDKGLSLDDAGVQAILAQRIATDALLREQERVNAVYQDFTNITDQGLGRFADLIAQGKFDWDSWKDAAKSAITDVIREFEQLGAINPLENALFGGDRSTLKDAGGVLGGLTHKAGGAAAAGAIADSAAKDAAKLAATSAQTTATAALTVQITAETAAMTALTTAATTAATALASISVAGAGSGIGGGLGDLFSSIFDHTGDGGLFSVPNIPHLAGGTDYWKGGVANVFEQGGEIIDLPRGTRVYPHDISKQMAKAASNDSGPLSVVFNNTYNAPGADAARLARLEGVVAQSQSELATKTVNTVNDAIERRYIRGRRG